MTRCQRAVQQSFSSYAKCCIAHCLAAVLLRLDTRQIPICVE
ncbi:hypothetical protein PAMC26510_06565 [Caballeronia sordidicola]|uniref:Uncharacterized protein n=1 Tax=Caballeronia sordidicola TaxID=196367 RepID=A0A242MK27_CABSO|nr:hypothetical protein PAMC26577_24325 [Caballeronia sordidicola]OTP79121.1 hypothetical protein PAMC26510_06565 [Caballeronia sordidicola]